MNKEALFSSENHCRHLSVVKDADFWGMLQVLFVRYHLEDCVIQGFSNFWAWETPTVSPECHETPKIPSLQWCTFSTRKMGEEGGAGHAKSCFISCKNKTKETCQSHWEMTIVTPAVRLSLNARVAHSWHEAMPLVLNVRTAQQRKTREEHTHSTVRVFFVSLCALRCSYIYYVLLTCPSFHPS